MQNAPNAQVGNTETRKSTESATRSRNCRTMSRSGVANPPPKLAYRSNPSTEIDTPQRVSKIKLERRGIGRRKKFLPLAAGVKLQICFPRESNYVAKCYASFPGGASISIYVSRINVAHSRAPFANYFPITGEFRPRFRLLQLDIFTRSRCCSPLLFPRDR